MIEKYSITQQRERIKALEVLEKAKKLNKPVKKVPATESAFSRGQKTKNFIPKSTKKNQVKELLEQGKTIPEISRIMGTSEKNVKMHIYLLKKKK